MIFIFLLDDCDPTTKPKDELLFANENSGSSDVQAICSKCV